MSLNVQCLNQVDPVEWDQQAASLGGRFYHCHAATIYSARLLGARPLFIRAIDETGRCVGVATGTIASPNHWPFSRYCRQAMFAATPVANSDEQTEAELLRAIEKRLRAQGACRVEFSSYHSPNSNRLLAEGGYALAGRHEYEVDLTRDIDELFSALPSYRRSEVRRAEKRGVTVEEVSTPEGADTVRRFHDLSMEHRGASTHRLGDTILEARRELIASGRVRILVSLLHGEPVGAESFGVFNHMAYGLEAGSSELGKRNFSSVYLNWFAIRLFRQDGLARLGLGGAKQQEESLRKFKQRFGAIETPQPTGVRIISRFGGRLDALRQRLRKARPAHQAQKPDRGLQPQHRPTAETAADDAPAEISKGEGT